VSVNPWLSIELGGVYLAESRNDDYGFGLSAGRASACVHTSPRSWSLAGCAGSLVGAMYGVPYVLAPAEPGARFWLATSLSVEGALHVSGPFYASVGVDGLIAPVRPRFSLEGSGQTIFDAPLFGAMTHAALLAFFR
jgi:hypothetical protein